MKKKNKNKNLNSMSDVTLKFLRSEFLFLPIIPLKRLHIKAETSISISEFFQTFLKIKKKKINRDHERFRLPD